MVAGARIAGWPSTAGGVSGQSALTHDHFYNSLEKKDGMFLRVLFIVGYSRFYFELDQVSDETINHLA